jgi:hypothetical protein
MAVREREREGVARVRLSCFKEGTWACRVPVLEQSRVDVKEGVAAIFSFKILPRT